MGSLASMRKALFIGTALFLFALAVCLVPYRQGKMNGYQENLWTAEGWGSPAPVGRDGPDLIDWHRAQYGIKWAWLVVDRQVGGKAWFARVESRALLIYLMMAVSAGVIMLLAAWKLGKRLPAIIAGENRIWGRKQKVNLNEHITQ